MLCLLLLVLANADTVSDQAWEHFALVNQLRAEGYTCPNGASYAPNPTPLNFDCRLWRASRLHSEDMASQNYFSHTSLDGRSPWDRAEEQGISANGENIAAGRSSASGALEQWKNSDGHCKNMMSSKHHVFAVGYAYDSSARYKHYWTQMLKHSDVSDLDTSCYPATATISTTSETTTMTESATTTQSATTTGSESSTSATTMSTTTTSSDTSTTGSATQSSTSATTSSITETSSETSMTATQTTEAQVQGENTSQGTVTSTAATGTSVTSVASSTSLQVTTAEVARSDMTTTTTTLASVTGKLLLQVSDSEAFLAAASRLQGPLIAFLAELLRVPARRISLFFARARRLRAAEARRLSQLALDYAVELERDNISQVAELLALADPNETSHLLQETLEVLDLNLTVEVVELVLTLDQKDREGGPPFDPTWWLIGAVGALLVFACLAGLLCLRRSRRRGAPRPAEVKFPTILKTGSATMASTKSEVVITRL
mmetsp:Transcript_101583/g.242187  ORF Transcript_101583/g.242187 Transcript_101583/m.242187 type:complete len:490 (-) Transcript_101583:80-1549(-)